MIYELALIIVLNAFLIAGLHIASWSGMIFDFVENIDLPVWIAKPLYDCPTCMASVHSTYVYALIVMYYHVPVWGWLLYVPTLAGVSTLLWRMIERMERDDPWYGSN